MNKDEFIKIADYPKGHLYKTTKIIVLNNVSSLFGLEKFNDEIFYIKWDIDNKFDTIIDLDDYEKKLKNYFNSNIKSNIVRKKNYPIMLNTKINTKKNIICSEVGEVFTIREFIEKKKKYNIVVSVENVFVSKNKEINYSFNVLKISNAL